MLDGIGIVLMAIHGSLEQPNFLQNFAPDCELRMVVHNEQRVNSHIELPLPEVLLIHLKAVQNHLHHSLSAQLRNQLLVIVAHKVQDIHKQLHNFDPNLSMRALLLIKLDQFHRRLFIKNG